MDGVQGDFTGMLHRQSRARYASKGTERKRGNKAGEFWCKCGLQLDISEGSTMVGCAQPRAS